MSESLLTPTNDGLLKQKFLNDGPGQVSTSHQNLNSSQKPTDDGLPILTPLYEIWRKASQDIVNRKDKPEFRTGLTSLDEILWGIHKKETMSIGARTSHGKSSFAINLVRNLADTGHRIIYFSLEMSKEQLLEKLFCNLCEVNNLDLRHGQAKKEFLDKQEIFKKWISEIKLLIDDKYGYDFNNLLKVCDIIRPDFVVVDYIQMISTKGYRSKVDAIEEYVRKFAELAITKNFGAIILSQLNRSGIEGPSMSAFKWAGVLEEHPATCLVLNYNREKGTFTVQIEKQRHGEVKNVEIKFIPQYSQFRDLTEDEQYDIETRKKYKGKTGGLYTGYSQVDR